MVVFEPVNTPMIIRLINVGFAGSEKFPSPRRA